MKKQLKEAAERKRLSNETRFQKARRIMITKLRQWWEAFVAKVTKAKNFLSARFQAWWDGGKERFRRWSLHSD